MVLFRDDHIDGAVLHDAALSAAKQCVADHAGAELSVRIEDGPDLTVSDLNQIGRLVNTVFLHIAGQRHKTVIVFHQCVDFVIFLFINGFFLFCLCIVAVNTAVKTLHGLHDIACVVDNPVIHNEFTQGKISRCDSFDFVFVRCIQNEQSGSVSVCEAGAVEPVRNFIHNLDISLLFLFLRFLFACFSVFLPCVRIILVNHAGNGIKGIAHLFDSVHGQRKLQPFHRLAAIDINLIKLCDTGLMFLFRPSDHKMGIIIPEHDG